MGIGDILRPAPPTKLILVHMGPTLKSPFQDIVFFACFFCAFWDSFTPRCGFCMFFVARFYLCIVQFQEMSKQSTTEKNQLEKQLAQLTRAKDALEKEVCVR